MEQQLLEIYQQTLNQINVLAKDVLNQDFKSLTSKESLTHLGHQMIHGPIFPYIFAIHVFFTCCRLRQHLKNQHWLFSLIMSCFATVGGGTMASYMVCNPPSWLYSNTQLPLMIGIWYLVNFSPFDIVYKLYTFFPLRIPIVAVENMNRCRSMFHGMELAVQNIPNSAVAAILLGSVAGIGGTLVTNFVIKVVTNPQSPSEFSKPTWSLKSAFFACVYFYFTWNPHSLLPVTLFPVDTAKLIVMGYLIAHAVAVELVGPFTPPPINVIEFIFFLITRIKTEEPTLAPTEIRKSNSTSNLNSNTSSTANPTAQTSGQKVKTKIKKEL